MKIQCTKADRAAVIGAGVASVVVASVAATSPWLFAIYVLLHGLVLGLLLLSLEHRRCMLTLRAEIKALKEQGARDHENDFRQTEALIGLYCVLQPASMILGTRGWAASPDFLAIMAQRILAKGKEKRDLRILEASSGISTVVIATCVKRLGTGKVLSLEHDQEYAQKTRQMLLQHGLAGHAEVIHAPLVPHVLHNGTKCMWYSLEAFPSEVTFDIVVVDGPPSGEDSEARYPCLPLVHASLALGADVLLDDADRPGERAVVNRWVGEHLCLVAERPTTEKGCVILRVQRS